MRTWMWMAMAIALIVAAGIGLSPPVSAGETSNCTIATNDGLTNDTGPNYGVLLAIDNVATTGDTGEDAKVNNVYIGGILFASGETALGSGVAGPPMIGGATSTDDSAGTTTTYTDYDGAKDADGSGGRDAVKERGVRLNLPR